MSRIGDRVLTIPAGVTITVGDNTITVKGPKGELSTNVDKNLTVKVNDSEVTIQAKDEVVNADIKGTTNANIRNMITGVTEGFKKELEAVGVGYRFQLSGNKVVLAMGYSHPVNMEIPAGLKVECPSNTELTISGIDKQLIGEFAANIRKVRKPEPYKGKGIRYKNEHVLRKEGKKAA